MARFALTTLALDENPAQPIKIQCQTAESLAARWGRPTIIAMNPPFLSWSDMGKEVKEGVVATLGKRYAGRADLAYAFVAKAIDRLDKGSCLATIVPASFLDSAAGSRLRASIVSDRSLRVRVLGHFQGYRYFSRASVEPAFLVIEKLAREPRSRTTVFITATHGFEDHAIRSFRMHGAEAEVGTKWRIAEVNLADLGAVWSIRSPLGRGLTTVDSLFDVRLGIRVGSKPAFMLTPEEYSRLDSSERSFFRPVADKIAKGQIVPSDFVFFPYNDLGHPLISSEAKLEALLPTFYRSHLLPNKNSLKARPSHHHPWWELARPRGRQWTAGRARFASLAFGQKGAFAFDERGEFVVVQGAAWFPRRRTSQQIFHAYLALLNSEPFWERLRERTPALHGGYCELYPQRVNPVEIPDLYAPVNYSQMLALASVGKGIAKAWPGDAELNELAEWAFGQRQPPRGVHEIDLAQEFADLVKRWQSETSHWSSVGKRLRHPAYQSIIELGPSVVALLLGQLSTDQDDWFHALTELTGQQPVPQKHFGDVEKVTAAWINWGKDSGYTW
jgi:hypothetical protein